MTIEIVHNSPQTFSVALAGPQGPPGPTGAQGASGTPGTNGTNGTNGANGATWYSGSSAPSNGLGAVNDFYVNTTTFDVHKKTGASTWTLQMNIKGAAGVDGAAGSQGPQGIQGIQGVKGDTGDTGATGPAGGNYPWVFSVLDYGATGNGKMVRDGAITSGTNTLTCTTSAPFVVGDIGKSIMIKGAGSTPQTSLITTITGFISSTQVTIGTNAVTTISNALVMFGTDDTVAIQNAMDAAVAYAVARSGNAIVMVPPAPGQFYTIAGPLKTNRNGNAQLTFAPQAATGRKISISIEGFGSGSAVQHWQQQWPTLSGATLVSFGAFATSSAQTSNINASGNPAVIGAPSQPGGYGVAPGVFSNMHVRLRGISILTSYSLHGLTYSAFDFSGLANASIESIAYGTTGIVASNDFASPNTFANGLSIGGLMPAAGNNDNCMVRDVTVHGGYTYAFFATEHTVVDTMRLLYCWSAFCVVGNYYGSVGATHAVTAQQLSIEACTNVLYIIGVGSAGIGPFIDIPQLDTETSSPTFSDNTAGNGLRAALGTVKLTGLYTAANVTVSNPTGLKIIDGQKAYPVVTKTANYTAKVIDDTIIGDATAGDITITLHSALYTPNTFTIQKKDATANKVIVNTGAGNVELTTQGATAKFIPVAGAWVRI